MTKTTPTARRTAALRAARELAEQLSEWRRSRAAEAKKRAKERALELRRQPRGVDRVPAHLTGLEITVEPHEVGKHGTRIDSSLGVWNLPGGRRYYGSNYAERRRFGQRGRWSKSRPPRRRDMPGAQARRIERNRKAWSA